MNCILKLVNQSQHNSIGLYRNVIMMIMMLIIWDFYAIIMLRWFFCHLCKLQLYPLSQSNKQIRTIRLTRSDFGSKASKHFCRNSQNFIQLLYTHR